MYKVKGQLITRALPILLCLVLILSATLTFGLSANAAVSEWAAGTSYVKGDIVSYQSKYYECLQPHTALQGWEPANVASLWKLYDGPVTVNTPTSTPTSGIPSVVPQGNKISGYTAVDFDTSNTTIKAGFKAEVVGTSYSSNSDNSGYFNMTNLASSTSTRSVKISKNYYLARTISNLPGSGEIVIGKSTPVVIWAGDINQDGVINMADIMELSKCYNKTSADAGYISGIDFNLDGAINLSDVMIVVRNFNKTAADYPVVTDIIVTTPLPNSNTPTNTPTPTPSSNITPPPMGNKLLVGYWHNFDNGSTVMKLKDVSAKWDVLNVAFAETTNDRAIVEFAPFNETEEEFKAGIAYLNSKGKKVVLSVGGQNGVLLLPDDTAKQKFINSAIALIDKYGFNGIDIDLEGGSNMSVNAGGDFKNPKEPQLVNLIAACKALKAKYGPGFIISMAPEVAYVQGGITAYATNWGGYLPVIYGLRDELTYIHVQHYNCGGNTALDGQTYNQGTADFEVAMAEMLLKGFPIGGNNSNMFPALREDQVMIGLPANGPAAPSGGYINPTEMKKALDYIIKGQSFGGKYKTSKAYPGFRGLMTWSVNWDAAAGYEFSNNYRAYFDALGQ